MKKYSLEFVNESKPFTMPHWTVGKHKAALEELLSDTKDWDKDARDEEYQFYVILQTLRQIDNEVTIEKIKDMHPEDLISLFNAVYTAGKTGILFQQPKKSKNQK